MGGTPSPSRPYHVRAACPVCWRKGGNRVWNAAFSRRGRLPSLCLHRAGIPGPGPRFLLAAPLACLGRACLQGTSVTHDCGGLCSARHAGPFAAGGTTGGSAAVGVSPPATLPSTHLPTSPRHLTHGSGFNPGASGTRAIPSPPPPPPPPSPVPGVASSGQASDQVSLPPHPPPAPAIVSKDFRPPSPIRSSSPISVQESEVGEIDSQGGLAAEPQQPGSLLESLAMLTALCPSLAAPVTPVVEQGLSAAEALLGSQASPPPSKVRLKESAMVSCALRRPWDRATGGRFPSWCP